MNKENLNALLDSIYELEGLVHLALTRDDNPVRLPELIIKKGGELSRLASRIAGGDEKETDVNGNSPVEASQIAPEPLYVAPTDSEEEIRSEESFHIEDSFGSADDTFSVGKVDEVDAEDDIESEVETESVDEVGNAVAGNLAPEPRGRLVFSINDRYRFKRELFGNSDADFNNTLALVASMEGYDEAEDYFLGELQWDQKKTDVVDFLQIIKKYFKE